MDDITLNLIVISGLSLCGIAVFIVMRRRQSAAEQQFARLAEQRGWTYTPIRERLAGGLRLQAPRWNLESITRSSGKESGPGSSDMVTSTTWQADAPGSLVLIGPRPPAANLGSLGDSLVRQVLRATLGEEAAGLQEIQAGSATLRQKYMVWGESRFEVEYLFTPAAQDALEAWKGTAPLVKRTSRGLSIELRGQRLKRPEEIEGFIRLCEAFL